MAMVLLLLILYVRTRRDGVLLAGIAFLVLDMVFPQIYAPIAILWFGLSHLLGTIMSKILLSILFFGILTPIAILRRAFGKDSLKLRAFKKSEESVMSVRNHLFVARDIEKPY